MSKQTAAVPSALESADTRSGFLRKVGVGGATVLGGGALLAGAPGVARAGHTDNVPDVDVLNFALTLEYLEAAFYTQALGGPGTVGAPASSGVFTHGGHRAFAPQGYFSGFGPEIENKVLGYLLAIRDHEVIHVDFLRSALGAAAVGPCTFNFSAALGSFDAFLKTAGVLENTGVMAYDGAIRYVDTGDFLQAGAQIATVEARHAAYLNLLNRTSPFPDAFDMGKHPSQIIAAVQATGFIVSCPPEVLALFGRLP